MRSSKLKTVSLFETGLCKRIHLFFKVLHRNKLSQKHCLVDMVSALSRSSHIFLNIFCSPCSQLRHTFCFQWLSPKTDCGRFATLKKLCPIRQLCLSSFSWPVWLLFPVSPGRIWVTATCSESASGKPKLSHLAKNNHTLKSLFSKDGCYSTFFIPE